MKQNSRKDETMAKGGTSLGNKEEDATPQANRPINAPENKAGDTEPLSTGENSAEITRAADGRPGTYGIIDI